MSKPSYLTTWATAATYASGPYAGQNTKVEPSSGQKAAGYAPTGYVPAQWLNSWMNGVDQWVQWLSAFESTAHTWTASQSFAAGLATGSPSSFGDTATFNAATTFNAQQLLSMPAGASAGALNQGLLVTGAANSSTNTSSAGGIGIQATGGASTGNGSGAVGVKGIGGTVAGNGGSAGKGVWGVGGAVNGSTNTSSPAGEGGNFVGGSISSDANGRVGGAGVVAAGGTGQDGTGAAFHGTAGDLVLDSGNIQCSGTLLASGGVIAQAPITVVAGAGYQNGWVDSGGGIQAGRYFQDPFGYVHIEGAVKNSGGTGTSVIFQLPVGLRPSAERAFALGATLLVIQTNGNVTSTSYGGGSGTLFLDGIVFAV